MRALFSSSKKNARKRYNLPLSQPALFEHDFRTARPARPVFCHQEFLDKLSARRNDPIGKRTSLLMQDGTPGRHRFVSDVQRID
jgi:hypothetical protein